MDLTLNQFIQIFDHILKSDAYKAKQISLLIKKKRAAETSSNRLHDIFDDSCCDDPQKTQISFLNIWDSRRELEYKNVKMLCQQQLLVNF